jgi:hypothetical protein
MPQDRNQPCSHRSYSRLLLKQMIISFRHTASLSLDQATKGPGQGVHNGR